MNKDKFPNKHAENGCFLAGQQTGIFIICHLTKVFLLYVDINYANVHNLTSQIKEVLRLVFLRFCVSLRSLVAGTYLVFFLFCGFLLLFQSCVGTHMLWCWYSMCYMDIFYININVKKAAESDFGI